MQFVCVDCNNTSRIELRVHLGLHHLRENYFKHNFQDSVKPFCDNVQDIESVIYLFLLYLLMKDEFYSVYYIILAQHWFSKYHSAFTWVFANPK